jgi:hypothetical protein
MSTWSKLRKDWFRRSSTTSCSMIVITARWNSGLAMPDSQASRIAGDTGA